MQLVQWYAYTNCNLCPDSQFITNQNAVYHLKERRSRMRSSILEKRKLGFARIRGRFSCLIISSYPVSSSSARVTREKTSVISEAPVIASF